MSLDNIINVSFGATNKCRTRPLYVLDYGIYLQINDDRIDDSTVYAVHFSKQKSGSYYSVIKTEQGVKIPEALLQSDGTIYAWLYYHTGESDGETLFEIEIPIIARPDTPAVIPTPHDHDLIEDAIAALNAGVEEAREYAAAADASAIDAAGSADDAAASATTAGNAATAAESSASTAYNHAQDANGYAVAAGNAKTAAETAQGKAETAQGKAEDAQTAAEAAAAQTALDVVAAGQSADAAAGSAGEASGYANDASGYATLAQGFANNASGFADNASGYATNAYNSATAAAGSAGEASGYATSASGYASAANDAKVSAQGAQTAAETAQGLAEAAQTGAEAAQTAAETARDAAIAATEDKAPVILDSASGAIVSISDGAGGMNARSLVASMSPIQDLHGQAAPYPAGGGKNVFKCYAESDTVNGITFIVNADGTVLANGTATADVIYTLSRKYEGSPQSSYCYLADIGIKPDTSYVLNGSFGGTADTYRLQLLVYGSGAEPSSPDGDSTPFSFNESDVTDKWYRLSIRVFNGTTLNNVIFKPMIRLASVTDDTYAPYENICPISGRTGLTAYRTGVNVWDEEWEEGYYSSQGAPSGGSGYIRSKNYISVKPNESYFCKTGTASNFCLQFYGADKAFLSQDYTLRDSVVTIPSDCYYLRFWRNETAYANNISINYPATDTAYHAYTGASYPVTWQDEAGTVYGGTVDVVIGLLTVTHSSLNLGTQDWENMGTYWRTSYNEFVRNDLSGCCERYKVVIGADVGTTSDSIGVNGTGQRLYIHDERYSTPEEIKAALNGVLFVAKLQTPQTYQLDPQTVSMLLGANNVWATGDSVSLTYPCDTKLYMERLTAPTEEDMVANANIANDTYFMVGNNLYLSTAAIAAGNTIQVGVNCVSVSLPDALNALKS